MRKMQILSAAFIAIFLLIGLASTNATAAEWLKGREALTKPESATADAKLIFVHNGGSLGKAKLECSVKLIGTVNTGGKGQTKLVENLSGSESDLIGGCVTVEGFCIGAVVHPINFPWETQLEAIGGKTWGKSHFNYDVLCSFGIQVTCEATSINARFVGNGVNGAQFVYRGTESGKMECSDGGEGTLESTTPMTVLGFEATGTATPYDQWLKGGETITKAENATTDGTVILVHNGGTLGKAELECSVQLVGTVSPEGKDQTTLVENLSGAEKDLIGNCKAIEGFCFGAVIHPTELPWTTQLEDTSEKTWDTTRFGYSILCSFGVQVSCTTTSMKALFIDNGASGSYFSYRGPESGKMTCSDGGESTLESPLPLVVLGFEAAGTPHDQWLKNGEVVAKAESATIDAKVILFHEGGSLGKAKIECDYKSAGTVSPESKDETTLVESLQGEQDLLDNCKDIEGFCVNPEVHATKLPWTTQLEDTGGKTWDATKFDYSVLCSSSIIECNVTSLKALFDGNGANGAEFSYKGAESGKMECSNGGEGTVESPTPMTVLEFTTSGRTWLQAGKEVTHTESATTDSTVMIVQNGGTLGNIKIECDTKLIGTVGPEGKDETKLVESLTGERDLIGTCRDIEGLCSGAVIHATKLPWTSQLEEISGKTWDTTKFGYDVLCSVSTQVECAATSIKARFEQNGPNGAEFSYKGAESGKMTCNDGGENTIESPTFMTVLGFTVS